jgi:hypothetical protein
MLSPHALQNMACQDDRVSDFPPLCYCVRGSHFVALHISLDIVAENEETHKRKRDEQLDSQQPVDLRSHRKRMVRQGVTAQHGVRATTPAHLAQKGCMRARNTRQHSADDHTGTRATHLGECWLRQSRKTGAGTHPSARRAWAQGRASATALALRGELATHALACVCLRAYHLVVARRVGRRLGHGWRGDAAQATQATHKPTTTTCAGTS